VGLSSLAAALNTSSVTVLRTPLPPWSPRIVDSGGLNPKADSTNSPQPKHTKHTSVELRSAFDALSRACDASFDSDVAPQNISSKRKRSLRCKRQKLI
jgi:hypothetical protein